MHLITRGDFDGLACAVLLSIVEDIESIRFAHPKDMQDGLYPVGPDDIIANLPYHPDCALWFDHHCSSIQAAAPFGRIEGAQAVADSCARVIYDHYADERFREYDRFLDVVDRFDAAKLTREDVERPRGWMMIAFTMDPRSGLGRFREYFVNMVEWVRRMSLEEILQLPEVKRRCEAVQQSQEALASSLKSHCRREGGVVVTDFRDLPERPVGNRFLVYTLFDDAIAEVRVFRGKESSRVVIAVGKSIFNRECPVNIGEMLATYGGGGHDGAGTCQVDPADADRVVAELVTRLNGK